MMKYWIYPLFVAAGLFAGYLGTERVRPEQFPLLVGGLSIVAMIICEILERALPFRREWRTPRGDIVGDFIGTNVVLPAVSQAATFFFTSILIQHGLSSSHLLGFNLGSLGLPLGLQIITALLVAELGYYWMHRISHNFFTLWRFHSVHHGAERVYWLNSGRFHPVDAALDVIPYIVPLVFFEASPQVVALIMILNAVTGLLEHANIDFDAAILNRVFNSAQLHRWHHSEKEEISRLNFGKVLSIWDQVFGTYYLPGPMSEIVGLGPESATVPGRFVGQLVFPFTFK